MTASDPLGLVPGIASRIRFDECVDAAGFGVLYRGWDLDRNECVAIKCVRPTRLANVSAARQSLLAARFLELAQTLELLSPPPCDIARCFGSGQLFAPTTGEPLPYVLLEWLDGQTLQADLARRRAQSLPRRSLPEALSLLEGVVRALTRGQSHGLSHGFIDPSAIFLAKTNESDRLEARLLDFGLARIFSDEPGGLGSARTEDGTPVFSLAHGAPEVLSGNASQIGPWSDVYSLALVLLELLRGEPLPFPRSGMNRASSFGVVLPSTVDEVVSRALAEAPSDRPVSAAALWSSIRDALSLGATSFDAGVAAAMEQVRNAKSGVAPASGGPFKGTMLMANAPGGGLHQILAPAAPRIAVKPEEPSLPRTTAPLKVPSPAAPLAVTAGVALAPSPLASSLGPGVVSPLAAVLPAPLIAPVAPLAAPAPRVEVAPRSMPVGPPAALPALPHQGQALPPPQALVPPQPQSRVTVVVVGLLVFLVVAVGGVAAWMLSHPR